MVSRGLGGVRSGECSGDEYVGRSREGLAHLGLEVARNLRSIEGLFDEVVSRAGEDIAALGQHVVPQFEPIDQIERDLLPRLRKIGQVDLRRHLHRFCRSKEPVFEACRNMLLSMLLEAELRARRAACEHDVGMLPADPAHDQTSCHHFFTSFGVLCCLIYNNESHKRAICAV